MKFHLNIKRYWLLFELALVKRATHWTKGVMNRTEDGHYIPFLDYDMMKVEYLDGEIQHLQEVFDLGDILLLQSSEKSFHAVGFDKLTALEFVTLLKNSSCDEVFRDVPRFSSYRNWVLRNFEKGDTPKPKVIKIYRRKNSREKSYAHYMYYKALYPIVIEGNFDKSQFVTFIEYPTAKV